MKGGMSAEGAARAWESGTQVVVKGKEADDAFCLAPGPMPFALPPAANAASPSAQPRAGLASDTCCLQVQPVGTHATIDNALITNLADAFPAPLLTDPWHRAHARNCAHAIADCAACSISLTCCSCHSLRFNPGPTPTSPAMLPAKRSRSTSPVLFRTDVGNGSPPPGFDSHGDEYDDDAFVKALAEVDTCDNSSCPNGADAPARYTITVEVFDDGAEEFYDRTYRACASCNRACKKSFLGNRIKSRVFDNSIKEKAGAGREAKSQMPTSVRDASSADPPRLASPLLVQLLTHPCPQPLSLRPLILPALPCPWKFSQSSLTLIASCVITRSLRVPLAQLALSAAAATSSTLPPPASSSDARPVPTSLA
jgi:hypothetical protein